MHLSSRFSTVTPPGNRLSITRIWLMTCWLQSFKRGGSARFRAGTPSSLAATAIQLSASWGWWSPPTVRPVWSWTAPSVGLPQANTHLPNKAPNPSLADVRKCLPLCPANESLAALVLDVSKAHRRVRIRPEDQGLPCFHRRGILYQSLTLNFGARASGFYWNIEWRAFCCDSRTVCGVCGTPRKSTSMICLPSCSVRPCLFYPPCS